MLIEFRNQPAQWTESEYCKEFGAGKTVHVLLLRRQRRA